MYIFHSGEGVTPLKINSWQKYNFHIIKHKEILKTSRKLDSQIMHILNQDNQAPQCLSCAESIAWAPPLFKRGMLNTAAWIHPWSANLFERIEHTQSLATQWMCVYNNERHHSSIGGIPPRKLLEAI